MLLSHHAPCDLDRTWNILGYEVCTRCLGVAVGLAVALPLDLHHALPMGSGRFLATFVLALAAIADFTSHELKLRRSNNPIRVASGLLFAPLASGIVHSAIHLHWAALGVSATAYALFAIASGMLLARAGVLDGYLHRYESAVYITSA